jgi:2-succinyl-5-enolpyruvyl-6-hydroxy-3-cyclohexene-1-carboxylate synthase
MAPIAGSGAPEEGPGGNLRAALGLLQGLQRLGLRQVVLCPGSRSAPLAAAAALLEPTGLAVYTCIDERSAAFFALGLSRGQGLPAAVITSSGSAVAHLLPACVEADLATIPLLLLTADRPERLKGCGANQSVNQQDFLRCSCRWVAEPEPTGMAGLDGSRLEALAVEAWRWSLGRKQGSPPGPVHLNLAFEEPLHAGGPLLDAWARQILGTAPREIPQILIPPAEPPTPPPAPIAACQSLDPDRPGVVLAGPWRGAPCRWSGHLRALIQLQQRTGWPVLADALSGLRGQPQLETVAAYDLVLERADPGLAPAQVLRLGTLPASRRLERWLAALDARQVLVSEADPRPLDPLARVAGQSDAGLVGWLAASGLRSGVPLTGEPPQAPGPTPASLALAAQWSQAEAKAQALLAQALDAQGTTATGCPSPLQEPVLVRQLSRLLPAHLPLMLANSSPVRDWESFADPTGPPRPMHGFRGVSGIDGTLSEACGLAEALGSLVLLSGDLAALHDSNGWLWRPQLGGRLTVLLIDNGGGGIFEQLPIRTEPEGALDFERLFAMPQLLDPSALAAAHGVPCRRVANRADLALQLAWALDQPLALLVLRTDRRQDAALRRRLRTMAALAGPPDA